jgi:hypothetical protein
VFRRPKLPKTRYKLIVGATTVERRDITPTDAPIHAPVLIILLLLHLPPLVEPTLFLLLRSRTILVEEHVIGIFFINDTSVVVLFDSGALCSFISAAYVEKHNLPIALLKCQMIVLREEICPHDSYA